MFSVEADAQMKAASRSQSIVRFRARLSPVQDGGGGWGEIQLAWSDYVQLQSRFSVAEPKKENLGKDT